MTRTRREAALVRRMMESVRMSEEEWLEYLDYVQRGYPNVK